MSHSQMWMKSQSARDRTTEFQNIVERVKKPHDGASSSGSLSSARALILQKSEFAKSASEIGLGIHKTSVKLQRLAQLAKRSSMFDDPTQEINEITGIVKQDIQLLHSSIAELQNLSTRNSRQNGGVQEQHHSATVVDNLRTRLKDTTKEFQNVLTARSENLKDQNQRRQIFTSIAENGFDETAEPLLDSTPAQALFGGEVQSGMRHDQVQLMESREDSYLANRAEAMQNVESTIIELGGIFQQLAHMVKEQGEMAVRIDENITETFSNVESAQDQLLKYLNNISSNRWLVLKIFFVLMIFMIFFVVFLA